MTLKANVSSMSDAIKSWAIRPARGCFELNITFSYLLDECTLIGSDRFFPYRSIPRITSPLHPCYPAAVTTAYIMRPFPADLQ
jgi:hypothetical protein